MWYQSQRPFKWLNQQEIYHTWQDIGHMVVPKLAALGVQQHCRRALHPLPRPGGEQDIFVNQPPGIDNERRWGTGGSSSPHWKNRHPVRCWTFTSHIFGITLANNPPRPLLRASCVCPSPMGWWWLGLALWPLPSNVSSYLSSLRNISWAIMCHFPDTYRKSVSIWLSARWIICSCDWHWLQVRLDLVVRFFPPNSSSQCLYYSNANSPCIARGLTLATLVLLLNQISLQLGHLGFHSHLWTRATQGKWVGWGYPGPTP